MGNFWNMFALVWGLVIANLLLLMYSVVFPGRWHRRRQNPAQTAQQVPAHPGQLTDGSKERATDVLDTRLQVATFIITLLAALALIATVLAPLAPTSRVYLQLGLAGLTVLGVLLLFSYWHGWRSRRQEVVRRLLQRKQERKLAQQGIHVRDKATKLYTREFWLRHLDGQLARRIDRPVPLTCLAVEVGSLAAFREQHGDRAADQVLTLIGREFVRAVRPEDIVCRHRDDSLAIGLLRCDANAGEQIGERMTSKVTDGALKRINQRYGADLHLLWNRATLPDAAATPAELLAAAALHDTVPSGATAPDSGGSDGTGIGILFLSKEDVDALELDLQEVMDAVEQGLKAHGEKQVIMPSKDHLALDYPERLFNILKGYVEPIDVAGVKVIGDFQRNYEHNLPSELALITLYRPETGAPFAIVDGTLITWLRTGAVTAVGAKYLASEKPRVLGHIGSRGTAWYNVHMLDLLFDFEEIRVTSKRPESRERFAATMSERLNKPVVVKDTTEDTVRDADIIIDASRLLEHQVLVEDAWVKPGALIQPYGAVLSVAPSLPFSVDKLVVDDWNQCQQSPYGQFAGLIQEGELRTEHIYGEIGEIVAGLKPGRESQTERILFWHKGFAVSDIMLGNLAYTKACEIGLGTRLTYYREPRDM